MINATVSLAITLFSFLTVFAVYGLYVMLILRNSKYDKYVQQINYYLLKSLGNQDLPNVTITIPAYNEEHTIGGKLQNIVELDYPQEKIEVIIVDDCSTDRTKKVANDLLKQLGLHGKIVKSSERKGANASYNAGILHASNSLVLKTDADVLLETDALKKAVQIISNIENIGGVTGIMVPVTNKATTATRLENTYRTLLDKMLIAESALHSTFPGNGGFTLLKKSCLTPISITYGSTDGNLSLTIIKKGFRHIYVPHTFSYEIIRHKLKQQVKQKVRRSIRLIQSVIMNRDILFNKKMDAFGTVIFPLRFGIFVICPGLTFVGAISLFFWLSSYSIILASVLPLALILVFYVGITKNTRFLSSFATLIAQQGYLLLGLLLAGKPKSIWT
jgi:biofilm PGA synthesis N-glycosyltransferase PgaC